jgi:hypothetical protein
MNAFITPEGRRHSGPLMVDIIQSRSLLLLIRSPQCIQSVRLADTYAGFLFGGADGPHFSSLIPKPVTSPFTSPFPPLFPYSFLPSLISIPFHLSLFLLPSQIPSSSPLVGLRAYNPPERFQELRMLVLVNVSAF